MYYRLLFKNPVILSVLLVTFIVLIIISLFNYLLFHALAEIFTIVIGGIIFILAWNTRKFIANNLLEFIGISYLFVALLDIFHTLSYPGMVIFSDYNYYANQVWIAARYLEAISFLVSFFYLGKGKIPFNLIFTAYSAVTILILGSIFLFKIFPVCYVEGVGQTSFKIYSEYVIILLFLLSIYLLKKRRSYFKEDIYKLLVSSIAVTSLSEFFFTFYFANDGIINMVGHILKIVSFYLIYKAIVETGLNKPFGLLFRDLKIHEERLTELNSTKDRLFSIIGHDLKAPFNSLIGFSDLLVRNFESFSEKERVEIYHMINKASKNAHHLLENLLEWSRVQTGSLKPTRESFRIQEIVDQNFDLLFAFATAKKIRLKKIIKDSQIKAFADKNMINTVLRNLINNAIKFTPEEGVITVEVIDDASKNLLVKVQDTGIGINEEDLQSLFKFNLSEKTTNSKGKGTGLGLIICREFLELNHGFLWAESTVGKGSIFSFTVPRATP